MFFQNIRDHAQVSYNLELGICLIIPDVSLKFSPPFQNIEAAFRCPTKRAVQKNDMMKHSTFAPVVKNRKKLHANLLKIVLSHG